MGGRSLAAPWSGASLPYVPAPGFLLCVPHQREAEGVEVVAGDIEGPLSIGESFFPGFRGSGGFPIGRVAGSRITSAPRAFIVVTMFKAEAVTVCVCSGATSARSCSKRPTRRAR